MILESGIKYRSFAAQKDFSFRIDITNSNVSGTSFIGFSGENTKINLFTFSSGKIFDFNNRYIWGYNPRETINISGNISSGYINYFVNANPICIFSNFNAKYYNNFYFSTENSIIDVDFFLKGQSPNYNFTFPLSVRADQDLTGIISNNSSPSNRSFQIFTGNIFITNQSYFLNSLPSGLISGNNQGSIILKPATSVADITNITPSQLTLSFQTNFGEIKKNINFNIIPVPVYYTEIITGFTGSLGFINDQSFRKLYSYEIKSLYPTNRNFTISLESVSGHTGQKIFDSFTITGNATGTASGFIYGFDYITGRVVGSGSSILRDYNGNFITGQINTNYKFLRYATGNFQYIYNLPLLGSGTGRSPEGTVIPAQKDININDISGFIFKQSLFYFTSGVNLEGFYFNSPNTQFQNIEFYSNNNISYTGNRFIDFSDYFWKGPTVSGNGYTGVGNLIYPIRGDLNTIIQSNSTGSSVVNSLIYTAQNTGNILFPLVKQNPGLFINSGQSFASENNSLSKNVFTGNNYFYITGQTGFVGFTASSYDPLSKGEIRYYSFEVDFNAQKQPYIFKLQLSNIVNPLQVTSNWTTIDTVTGTDFYSASPKIFTCKFPSTPINNTAYAHVRILIESGIDWQHKYSGNQNLGIGIKNLEFYKALPISVFGEDLSIINLVPKNIDNYVYTGIVTPPLSLSGVVLNTTDNPIYPAWHAFNENKSLFPFSEIIDNGSEMYIGYAVTGSGVQLDNYFLEFDNDYRPNFVRLEGSNDNQTYTTILNRPNVFGPIITGLVPFPQNTIFYKYIRFKFKDDITCAVIPPNNVDVNSNCYLQVILDDPFCCEVQWDSRCSGPYNSCIGISSSSSSSSSVVLSSSSSSSSIGSSSSSSSIPYFGGFNNTVLTLNSESGLCYTNVGGEFTSLNSVSDTNYYTRVNKYLSGYNFTQFSGLCEPFIIIDTGSSSSSSSTYPGILDPGSSPSAIEWKKIVLSSGGQIQVAVGSTYDIFASTIVGISHDYGETWFTPLDLSSASNVNSITARDPDIAISKDGKYQIISKNPGPRLYYSSDYGLSWIEKTIAKPFFSGNNTYVSPVAARNSSVINNLASNPDAYLFPYASVDISDDGKNLIAVLGGSNVYANVNDGKDWTKSGYVWSSNDSGNNWICGGLQHEKPRAKLSSNGQYQVVVENGSFPRLTGGLLTFPNTRSCAASPISISNNYGQNWSYQLVETPYAGCAEDLVSSGGRRLADVAISDDGSNVIAVPSFSELLREGINNFDRGPIYSRNYGQTWTPSANLIDGFPQPFGTHISCAGGTVSNYYLFQAIDIAGASVATLLTKRYGTDFEGPTENFYCVPLYEQYLYISDNLGFSNDRLFVVRGKDFISFNDVAISYNGRYISLAETNDGGGILVSNNYGNTFKRVVPIFIDLTDIYLNNNIRWGFENYKLVGNNTINNNSNQFGSSLDSYIRPEGQVLIVGSNGENNNQGAVYIYNESNDTKYTLEQKISNTGNFGTSVSVSDFGNILAIGSPSTNNNNGAVYIYRREQDPISSQYTLHTGIVGPSQSSFGASVALNKFYNTSLTQPIIEDGSCLVIGTPYYNVNSIGGAQVYIKNTVNSTWSLKQNLNNGATLSGLYGSKVAISDNGNIIAIGGPADRSVLIYTGNRNVGWNFAQKLTGSLNSSFGKEIAINEQYTQNSTNAGLTYLLAIGAPNDNNSAGSVSIYTGSNNFSLVQIITGRQNSEFGSSILINKYNSIYIGAPKNNEFRDNGGAIFIYNPPFYFNINSDYLVTSPDLFKWTLINKILPSNLESGYFGKNIAGGYYESKAQKPNKLFISSTPPIGRGKISILKPF